MGIKSLILSFIVNAFLLETAYAQTQNNLTPDKTFTVLRVAHFTSQSFDLATTITAVDTRGFHETNPIVGQNPVQQTAVMAGMAYGIDHAARILYPDHPRLAKLVLVVGSSAHFTFGTINVRRLRR